MYVLFNIDGEVKGELVFCAGPPVLLAAGALFENSLHSAKPVGTIAVKKYNRPQIEDVLVCSCYFFKSIHNSRM